MTNNSSHSRRALLSKFHRLGFTGVTAAMVFSSGYATALYLKQRAFSKTVFAVGADGLVEELEQAGLRTEGGSTAAQAKAGLSMAAVQQAIRC